MLRRDTSERQAYTLCNPPTRSGMIVGHEQCCGVKLEVGVGHLFFAGLNTRHGCNWMQLQNVA